MRLWTDWTYTRHSGTEPWRCPHATLSRWPRDYRPGADDNHHQQCSRKAATRGRCSACLTRISSTRDLASLMAHVLDTPLYLYYDTIMSGGKTCLLYTSDAADE